MAVNDELGELRRFLDAILGRLSLGGRLAVISFHSLEDRMVKQTMRYWAEGCRCPRHVPVCVCHHVPEVEILYKLALGLLACMTMCLILVWSNIERIDTTYFINIAQNKLQERKALRAKLEVERERLLSPYELRRKAEEIGMKEPKPGQVRRMEAH